MKVPTYTRKDVARIVAEKENISIQDADRLVNVVLASVREVLMSADPEIRLEVRDFGVFEVKLTRAKPRARNPKTGDKVYVPPRRKTHFRPSKLLRSFLTQKLDAEALRKLRTREEIEPNVYPMMMTAEDFIAR